MPVLDANALSTDADGLAFLRRAIGEPEHVPSLAQRFHADSGSRLEPGFLVAPFGNETKPVPVAPSPEHLEPCFADAFA